jgi:hypothetical protein
MLDPDGTVKRRWIFADENQLKIVHNYYKNKKVGCLKPLYIFSI